jgi:ribosome-associated protein
MEKNKKILLNIIAQAIFDKKGSNILALDMKPCSVLAEYVVIAEGNVDRHVNAIADSIEKAMAEAGWRVSFVQGRQTGDWVVLDYTDIVVHLFIPEVREKYQLEKLWQKAEIVDVEIDFEKSCLII